MRIIIEVENAAVKAGEETQRMSDAEQANHEAADAGAAPSLATFGQEAFDTATDNGTYSFDDPHSDAGTPPNDLLELLGVTPGTGTLASPSALMTMHDNVAPNFDFDATEHADGGGAPAL